VYQNNLRPQELFDVVNDPLEKTNLMGPHRHPPETTAGEHSQMEMRGRSGRHRTPVTPTAETGGHQ